MKTKGIAHNYTNALLEKSFSLNFPINLKIGKGNYIIYLIHVFCML